MSREERFSGGMMDGKLLGTWSDKVSSAFFSSLTLCTLHADQRSKIVLRSHDFGSISWRKCLPGYYKYLPPTCVNHFFFNGQAPDVLKQTAVGFGATHFCCLAECVGFVWYSRIDDTFPQLTYCPFRTWAFSCRRLHWVACRLSLWVCEVSWWDLLPLFTYQHFEVLVAYKNS